MTRPEYDKDNVFAKILRGEIPCNKFDECEFSLAFYDIQPQRKIHILVIPKGEYVDMTDFALHASIAEQAAFLAAIGRVVEKAGLKEKGYRVISNTGFHGHQDVPHLHMHVLGGEAVGPMLMKKA